MSVVGQRQVSEPRRLARSPFPNVEQLHGIIVEVHPFVALAKAVLLVKGSGRLVGLENVECGPARSAAQRINQQCRSNTAALVRRINEELVDVASPYGDEASHAIGGECSSGPCPFVEL